MESCDEKGMEDMIRIHNMILHTKALGPGLRTAIWLQGCERRCKGCMSPGSRPLDGGRLVRVSDVAQAVLQLSDVEGITVSGGEPFLQVDALYSLLSSIREKSNLGVIIYTGFTLEELRKMDNPKVTQIISEMADIIIDGEYVEELNDGIALKGSSNQRVNFITERYVSERTLYEQNQRDVEVIATESDMFLIGIPSQKTLEEWKDTTKQFIE